MKSIVLSTLNAKYIHTSLALRYLKAYSQKDFPDIQIAEYTIKDPAMNIVSDLYQRKPDVVGFSCYIWNIEETIVVIGMLKKIMPDLVVVLGGPEVSYDTDYWMNRLPEVDFIVMGEGEETFHHLLSELRGDRAFYSVFGAAYRKDGRVVINRRVRSWRWMIYRRRIVLRRTCRVLPTGSFILKLAAVVLSAANFVFLL